jgi:hypothetical protein
MLHSSRTKETIWLYSVLCIEFCQQQPERKYNTDAESVVQSLLQHMKLPLLEFRIHGDGSAEFVEAELDWDVFTTQLECIYHLQWQERRDTVLMRNNLVKCRKVGSRGWYAHAA